MNSFGFDMSLDHARQRFCANRSRSDRGGLRLNRKIAARLRGILLGQERPPMVKLVAEVACFCRKYGLRPPARATIYAALQKIEGHRYTWQELPAPVRETLYNLDTDSVVPGRQVVFACFQHGGLDAVSFASSLPWLDLYQADRQRGWRPRSHGLLRSVMKARAI